MEGKLESRGTNGGNSIALATLCLMKRPRMTARYARRYLPREFRDIPHEEVTHIARIQHGADFVRRMKRPSGRVYFQSRICSHFRQRNHATNHFPSQFPRGTDEPAAESPRSTIVGIVPPPIECNRRMIYTAIRPTTHVTPAPRHHGDPFYLRNCQGTLRHHDIPPRFEWLV